MGNGIRPKEDGGVVIRVVRVCAISETNYEADDAEDRCTVQD